jgi:ferredoxin-NADP reductase
MNERNICIGDIVAVGNDLVMQISLPRQPCFKLNQRFQLNNFAPNTWKLSRTGWYYRVLKEGYVKAGDEIRLIERAWPQWTIFRLQEYLHRNQNDLAMNEELAAIEALGQESRNNFKGRVAKARAKERKDIPKWRAFKVVEKRQLTPRISSFVFEAAVPFTEPLDYELKPGSHAKIKLPNGLVRNYSVVDGNKNKFQLGIALDEKSRGGSRYLHDSVAVGSSIEVGSLTVGVPLIPHASHHIFVAGGIGITAFLSMFEAYKSFNISGYLHYAVRSLDETPYRERLERLSDIVTIYDRSRGQRMDVEAILRDRPWNSQLYFCGPARLMEESALKAKKLAVPESDIHWEAFSADLTGDPFEVEVSKKGSNKSTKMRVEEDETLLEVLQKHFDVPSSCEVGNCGTCQVKLTCGRVEHRGTGLTDEEKKTTMLTCVSRGIGRIGIEI